MVTFTFGKKKGKKHHPQKTNPSFWVPVAAAFSFIFSLATLAAATPALGVFFQHVGGCHAKP